jgi:ATP-dependent RNA helicase DDX41
MPSVHDLKKAFHEDDDIFIPESSASLPKRSRGGDDKSGGGEAPVKAKEWWDIDDAEEEYVPLKKRRDQRVTASAARLGHKVRGAGAGDAAGSAGGGDGADDSAGADEEAGAGGDGDGGLAAIGGGAGIAGPGASIREFAPATKETTSLLSRAAGLKEMANKVTPTQRLADEEVLNLESQALQSSSRILTFNPSTLDPRP